MSSKLRLKGEALKLLPFLLIRPRQCAENLFVRIVVLPARNAEARLHDQVWIDLRPVIPEESRFRFVFHLIIFCPNGQRQC